MDDVDAVERIPKTSCSSSRPKCRNGDELRAARAHRFEERFLGVCAPLGIGVGIAKGYRIVNRRDARKRRDGKNVPLAGCQTRSTCIVRRRARTREASASRARAHSAARCRNANGPGREQRQLDVVARDEPPQNRLERSVRFRAYPRRRRARRRRDAEATSPPTSRVRRKLRLARANGRSMTERAGPLRRTSYSARARSRFSARCSIRSPGPPGC